MAISHPYTYAENISRRAEMDIADYSKFPSQSPYTSRLDNDTVPMLRLQSTYSSAFKTQPSKSASFLSLTPLSTGNHRREINPERVGRLQRSRLFSYLTIMATIMSTINILQIVLLPKFRSKAWIQGFPIIIFTITSVALIAYIIKARKALKESSDYVEASKRASWIGISISILLPIVFCGFIYINLVAVPSFNRIFWTSTVDLIAVAKLPAIIWMTTQVDIIGPPSCYVLSSSITPCLDNIKLNNTFSAGNVTYGLFNPSRSSPPIAFNLHDILTLQSEAYKNSSYPPEVFWNLLDPKLVDNFTHIWDCGFFEMMDINFAPLLGDKTMKIEQSTVNDDVGSFDNASSSSSSLSQNCSRKPYRHYNRWSSKFKSVRSVNATQCLTPRPSEQDNACVGNLLFSVSSLWAMTQTSSHSIDWKQMLLDEGSIVGGITFVTWFLSIFIT